jgi:lysyl-tRNA synthetase class 2
MKRLLGAGSGDIYQLGKAFRDGEAGSRHNPEFTLLEWYRVGMPVADLMDEVADLVLACLPRAAGVRTAGVYSYRELFLERLAIDPFEADDDALAQLARREVDVGPLDLTRDAWLDLLLTHCIEPALAERGLVFITDYPPSQAALARTAQRGGTAVAERFELYVDGVELANGYAELTDADELVARAQRDNDHRAAAGQEQRDLDPRLVAALRAGLPACSGVALGVDRLLMLRLGARSLAEVMPFSWPRS